MIPDEPARDIASDQNIQSAPARTLTVRKPIKNTVTNISRTTSSNNQGLTPGLLLQVFSNWWKWVVPLGLLLSCIAGVLVWHFYVPKYEARALIRIESEAPYIAFEQSVIKQDADKYVQTQIELLRGPVVLGPVLSREEIARIAELREQSDPLKYLKEHLSVRQVGKSELYEVAYESASANDAATVANAVVSEYLRLQNIEEKTRSEMVIGVLEEERKARGENVAKLRERVVNLAKSLTGKDPFGLGVVTDPTAFSSAAALQQNLTETEVEIEMLKAEIRALNNAPIVAEDKEMASGIFDFEIASLPDIRQAEVRIESLRQTISDVRRKPRLKIDDALDSDPEFLSLTAELKKQLAELSDTRQQARKRLMSMRSEQKRAEHERSLTSKELELNTLTTKRQLLDQKLQGQLKELISGGAQSAELEFTKAELEREERVFDLIAARKLALQTELRAPARVTPMQIANVPSVALEPIPYKYLLVACLLTLASPFAVALAYEVSARRISSAEDLGSETMLPILGEIARLPRSSSRKKSLTNRKELYVFKESVDSLRTQLMLTEGVGVPGQVKVVAVCSAASGEGKSSLATSLALSLAKATKLPTLLIDADLRSPDVAEYLGVPSRPGMAEILAGKAEISDAIHQVQDTQAYVFPAGKLRGNPHHLMEGQKIESLLATLSQEFSTIIIDTPPVLSASDALIYAKRADMVLFCSLADMSRAKQVRLAVDRLQSTGAHVAGAVLSGVSVSRYIYSYGTYGLEEA